MKANNPSWRFRANPGTPKLADVKTTLLSEGWYCTYTYPKTGEFNLLVVVPNHGYYSNELKPAVVEVE